MLYRRATFVFAHGLGRDPHGLHGWRTIYFLKFSEDKEDLRMDGSYTFVFITIYKHWSSVEYV